MAAIFANVLLKVAAVWDRARRRRGVVQPFHVWRLFFLCEIICGEPQCGPETSEVVFFAGHGLPAELSTRRALLTNSNACARHNGGDPDRQ